MPKLRPKRKNQPEEKSTTRTLRSDTKKAISLSEKKGKEPSDISSTPDSSSKKKKLDTPEESAGYFLRSRKKSNDDNKGKYTNKSKNEKNNESSEDKLNKVFEFNNVDEEDGFRDGEDSNEFREIYLPLNAASIINSRPNIKVPVNCQLPDADFSAKLSDIGGLDSHVYKVKESLVLPILYPNFFSNHDIITSRGILFHGPPGTGKTLLARGLVHECSQGNLPIAYFHFSSAEILSKWVGESETRIQKMFEAAKAWAPSILYFDEIDGLAPIRDDADRPSASLVSALLAALDGFDSLGRVLVIGSTNRLEAIDPALRRPGRFDEELYFSLPNLEARASILNIITSKWRNPIESELINKLATLTNGYCGADLKSLCDKAVKHAFLRVCPTAYDVGVKHAFDTSKLFISEDDFMTVMKTIRPAVETLIRMETTPVPAPFDKLMNPHVNEILSHIKHYSSSVNLSDKKYNKELPLVLAIKGQSAIINYRILSATLHALEDHRIHILDFSELSKPDDLTGCKELTRLLSSSSSYSKRPLFVIRDLRILIACSKPLVSLILSYLSTPCTSGSVTFLFTVYDLSILNRYLKGIRGYVVDTDKVVEGSAPVFFDDFISRYFDARMKPFTPQSSSPSVSIYNDSNFISNSKESHALRDLCLTNLLLSTSDYSLGDLFDFAMQLELEEVAPSYDVLLQKISYFEANHVKKSARKGRWTSV